VHCKNAIRRQVRHGLGQIDQGCDVMDGVGIGLPQKGSWGRRAPIGPGGPRGWHSEVSVSALGVSSNGWVCHLLLVMILIRTEIERARCIWSRGVDQDLPDHSPKMSIEWSRTFNRFPVCSWQGGGIGSLTGGSENEWAGGADEAAEA
jgi:hypothetical protein